MHKILRTKYEPYPNTSAPQWDTQLSGTVHNSYSCLHLFFVFLWRALFHFSCCGGFCSLALPSFTITRPKLNKRDMEQKKHTQSHLCLARIIISKYMLKFKMKNWKRPHTLLLSVVVIAPETKYTQKNRTAVLRCDNNDGFKSNEFFFGMTSLFRRPVVVVAQRLLLWFACWLEEEREEIEMSEKESWKIERIVCFVGIDGEKSGRYCRIQWLRTYCKFNEV